VPVADLVRLVPARTHGRILIREAPDGSPRGVLLGFHGYKEPATAQLERLAGVPGAHRWTLVSVQALHRFYLGRTRDVVASWMTSEDRDEMIADNIAYVDGVVEAVDAAAAPIVCIGFSQGVAMAFRAAARGRMRAAGVVGVGGDVPPELLADGAVAFPPVLLVRGTRDEWYTTAKHEADAAALAVRQPHVKTVTVEAGHEWTPGVAAAVGDFLNAISHP